MLCQWLGIHCGLMWGDYDENILYVSPLTADSHMSHPSPASRSQKSHVNYLIYHYYNYCQLLPAFLRSEIRNGTKQGAAICDQCPQERLPLFLCWEHLLPGLQSLVKLYWRVSWWLRGPCERDCWRDPSLPEISHDDPGQCSKAKASRTFQGEGGFQDWVLLQVFPGRHFFVVFRTSFAIGAFGLLRNLSGASRGFQKRLLNKNPFKKRLETICKIVEANCKFQITPQSRVLSFKQTSWQDGRISQERKALVRSLKKELGLKLFGSLHSYSSTFLAGVRSSEMNAKEKESLDIQHALLQVTRFAWQWTMGGGYGKSSDQYVSLNFNSCVMWHEVRWCGRDGWGWLGSDQLVMI